MDGVLERLIGRGYLCVLSWDLLVRANVAVNEII